MYRNQFSLKEEKSISKIQFYLISLFVFFLPVNQRISTILILLSVVVSLFRISNIKRNEVNIFAPLFVLYVLYVISSFRDTYEVLQINFESKASFVAFPFIFLTMNLTKEKINTILKVFVFGCVFSYVYLFLSAIFSSFNFEEFTFNPIIESKRNILDSSLGFQPLQTNYFLGSAYAFQMRSAILAVYYALAIGFIHYLWNGWKSKKIITILLFIGICQIFSLIGFLCLLMVVLICLKIVDYKYILFVGYSFFILSVLVFYNNEIKNKISEEIKSEARIHIWPSTIKTVKQNFFIGNGIKKAQRELEKNYSKSGAFGATIQKYKLDAHNTFFQILIEIGVIGFLLLMIILYYFFKYLNTKTGVIFITLALLLSISESMLNTYAGLSFFTFFYCLFVNPLREH